MNTYLFRILICSVLLAVAGCDDQLPHDENSFTANTFEAYDRLAVKIDPNFTRSEMKRQIPEGEDYAIIVLFNASSGYYFQYYIVKLGSSPELTYHNLENDVSITCPIETSEIDKRHIKRLYDRVRDETFTDLHTTFIWVDYKFGYQVRSAVTAGYLMDEAYYDLVRLEAHLMKRIVNNCLSEAG